MRYDKVDDEEYGDKQHACPERTISLDLPVSSLSLTVGPHIYPYRVTKGKKVVEIFGFPLIVGRQSRKPTLHIFQSLL